MSPAWRQPPQAHAPSCVLHSHTRGPSAHAACAVVGSPSPHLIRVCAALALHLSRTLRSCISFSPSLLLSFSPSPINSCSPLLSRAQEVSSATPPNESNKTPPPFPPTRARKRISLLPPPHTYEISTAPRLSSPASRARTMFLAVASMQSASWLSFLPHILGKKSSSSNWATPNGASPVRATRPMN